MTDMPANNKRPRVDYGNGRHVQEEDYGAEQRARKACINCRRQKMKCLIEDNNDECRRCRRSGLPCIFVPRANAATLPEFKNHSKDGGFKTDVLRRLQIIEDALGLSEASNERLEFVDAGDNEGFDDEEEASDEFNSLGALWDAVVILQSAPCSVPRAVWRRRTVRDLWLSFHDRMPGLHFMPRRQTFSAPQPILLASILYCSSMRGPPDMADIAPHYFTILCNAIAQLCIPGSAIGQTPADSEEWAFQTVLGIVIAGLLTEATVRETGIWISIAYRLILEHCPAHIDETSREWHAAVIRDWARQLDEWLVDFSQGHEGTDQDLKLVFRQYVLHRLVVLSIYHPGRGCDLWSNSITPKEQYELLLSARATLKLHLHDDSIWSNWDLIMITWAALIVVQGIEGGAGDPDGKSTPFITLLQNLNKIGI
ncbi:hypothetical protein TCE0_044f17142 [Talaromyces pinophilus]|uniref:Zn(2)-C6 fungal-type domain-containing protein n=1 Tax=Talaromyces pinophilus TaxID=128442 RepID=A0A478EBT3_TALPI|nr:hypothetical protein TCE0_044f17142 [Talaromyces pinophilus]